MNTWDIEELFYRASGKTEEEIDEEINNGDIDQAVYDKYDSDFDTYCSIVGDLIKFTPLIESPLTGNKFHAFVDVEKNMAIVKFDYKK